MKTPQILLSTLLVSVFTNWNVPQTLDTPTQRSTSVWDLSTVNITNVQTDRKLIAFTFDDAPSKTLESVLATFIAFNEIHTNCPATATVFCNGRLMNEHTLPLLHGAVSIGFELGNHTYSHYDITTLSPTALRSEIGNTDALLARIDGKRLHLFRAPYGKINDNVTAHIHAPLIDWTIDTLDWTGATETAIYSAVWQNRFSGAIVLMHDGYPNTVDALKTLLPDLYTDGYQVVSVSQLAKAHRCTLQTGKVYVRARKKAR